MSKISLQVSGEAAVERCFNAYTGKCKVRNLSERTIAAYRVDFRIFQRYLDDAALREAGRGIFRPMLLG